MDNINIKKTKHFPVIDTDNYKYRGNHKSTEAKKYKKTIADHEGNKYTFTIKLDPENHLKISPLEIKEIITDSQMAFRATNHPDINQEHKRKREHVYDYLGKLIEIRNEKKPYPEDEDTYSLLDEIVETAVSTKLTYKKLGTDEETHTTDLNYLIKLRKDDLPYPKSTYKLLDKLIQLTRDGLFLRQPDIRIVNNEYDGQSILEKRFKIKSTMEILPTVLRLYEKEKNHPKCHERVIEKLILLSNLPEELFDVIESWDTTASWKKLSYRHQNSVKKAYKSQPYNIDLIKDEAYYPFLRVLKKNKIKAYEGLKNELEYHFIPYLNELESHT